MSGVIGPPRPSCLICKHPLPVGRKFLCDEWGRPDPEQVGKGWKRPPPRNPGFFVHGNEHGSVDLLTGETDAA